MDLRDEYGYGHGLEMGPLTGYGYFLTTPMQNSLSPCSWLLGMYLSSLFALLVGAGVRIWICDGLSMSVSFMSFFVRTTMFIIDD